MLAKVRHKKSNTGNRQRNEGAGLKPMVIQIHIQVFHQQIQILLYRVKTIPM